MWQGESGHCASQLALLAPPVPDEGAALKSTGYPQRALSAAQLPGVRTLAGLPDPVSSRRNRDTCHKARLQE